MLLDGLPRNCVPHNDDASGIVKNGEAVTRKRHCEVRSNPTYLLRDEGDIFCGLPGVPHFFYPSWGDLDCFVPRNNGFAVFGFANFNTHHSSLFTIH